MVSLFSENSNEPSVHEPRRPFAAILGDHRSKVSQEVHLTRWVKRSKISCTALRLCFPACRHIQDATKELTWVRETSWSLTLMVSAGDDSIPNAVPNFSEMNKVKNRAAQMHQAFGGGKNLQSMEKWGTCTGYLELASELKCLCLAAAGAQPKTKEKQPSFR